MKISTANILGMDLILWQYKSCTATFSVCIGEGERFATLIVVRSEVEGRGHATVLLDRAKRFYEAGGFTFGGSIALTGRMRRIYTRLGIHEYK